MNPLLYLADMCVKIDKTYSVSLEYGAHAGDEPHWQMHVTIPFKAISLLRKLQRGDDTQANMRAAQSMAADLRRFIVAAQEESYHGNRHTICNDVGCEKL